MQHATSNEDVALQHAASLKAACFTLPALPRRIAALGDLPLYGTDATTFYVAVEVQQAGVCCSQVLNLYHIETNPFFNVFVLDLSSIASF